MCLLFIYFGSRRARDTPFNAEDSRKSRYPASRYFDIRGRTCLTAGAFTRVPVEIREGACGCILMNPRKNGSWSAVSRGQSITVDNDDSRCRIK